MSKRQLKSEDVTGFLEATWNEVRDTEMMYGVYTRFRFELGKTRGYVTFYADLYMHDGTPIDRLVGTAEVAWPTVSATSVHALLYRLAMRANLIAQNDHRERTGHWIGEAVD